MKVSDYCSGWDWLIPLGKVFFSFSIGYVKESFVLTYLMFKNCFESCRIGCRGDGWGSMVDGARVWSAKLLPARRLALTTGGGIFFSWRLLWYLWRASLGRGSVTNHAQPLHMDVPHSAHRPFWDLWLGAQPLITWFSHAVYILVFMGTYFP